MEETSPEIPVEPTAKKGKAKARTSFANVMALIEVHERRRVGNRPNYKTIAARHGLKSWQYLKFLDAELRAGRLDLGEPQTVQEREFDATMQREKKVALLRRYEALLLTAFEGLLFRAEDEMTEGDSLAFQKLELPKVVRELKETQVLREKAEKLHSRLLQEAGIEKVVKGSMLPQMPDNAGTRLASMSDDALALEAFAGE